MKSLLKLLDNHCVMSGCLTCSQQIIHFDFKIYLDNYNAKKSFSMFHFITCAIFLIDISFINAFFYISYRKSNQIDLRRYHNYPNLASLNKLWKYFILIMLYGFHVHDIHKNSCFLRESVLTISPSPNQFIFGYWSCGKKTINLINMICVNETTPQGRSYYQMNIDISYCSFSRSSAYSGDGGVIYVYGGSYSLNSSHLMFYNCSCQDNGGAIHFYSQKSTIKMICANRCTADYGHFAFIKASQINIVEYLSISYCSKSLIGYRPLSLGSGNQTCDHTNSSMNCAKIVSGFRTWAPSSFTSSFCTFSHNNVSNGICLEYDSNNGVMLFANIVHNNSPLGEGVIRVYGNGSFIKKYCIFNNNKNTLFYIDSGFLEVLHSYIDHSGQFSYLTSVSTANNNSFSFRETYLNLFFYSHYCNSEYPLRTKDKTPMITHKETLSNTIKDTAMISLFDQNSFMITQKEKTMKETPYRSYIECEFSFQKAHRKEMNIIFAFSFFITFLDIQ